MSSEMISLSSLFMPRKQTSGDWPEENGRQGQRKFPRSTRNKGTLFPGNNKQWYHLPLLLLFHSQCLSPVPGSLWGGGKVTSLQDITQDVVQLVSRVVRVGIQPAAAEQKIAVASCGEELFLLKEDFCCKVSRGKQNMLRSYRNFPPRWENVDLCYKRETLSPDLSSQTLRALFF